MLTADGQINISQSKVKVWTQCRRMYHYKFVMLLQKKKIKRPFMFGRIVHEIIEAEIEGHDWEEVLAKIELDNKKLFRKEIEMYGNIIDDIRDIMTDYFRFWEGTLKPMKHDGRRSEFEFRIELDDGLWFTGRIDTVGKAKGMRWLVEHKTFNRMPSEDDRWRSVQGAVYFRALEQMGFPSIDGVMWDYVNSKPLNVPGELTKTGKVSQARIDSTPARIKRWLKEEGLKKKDNMKLLTDAEANLKNRFIRVYSPVKRRVVDNIWDNFVDTAREIQELHGTKSGQNIGRHCTWCDYQPLCKAEATGADIDWIIDREYQSEDTSHKRDAGGAYDGLGPKATGVTRSGAVLTVAVNLNGATSLSGSALTSWQVAATADTAFASPLAISSVTVTGNQVVITLASAPAGPVRVRNHVGYNPDVSSWALGNYAGGTTIEMMPVIDALVSAT